MTRTPVYLVSIGAPGAPEAATAQSDTPHQGHTKLAPRDADELADLVRRHEAIEVWFPSLAVFLETLWSGRVPAEVWRRVQVRCGVAGSETSGRVIEELLSAWESFTSTSARRRRTAALALSATVIIAAATVLWLA